ncbi:MAG: M28 family peptidase, partial [Thermoleophilia bacterium]|nr:M28 family peptidase [Thermoleophilia bacterium]
MHGQVGGTGREGAAYYSPAMVAARPPRRRRRRPPEQAVDAHLVRTAALVLIPAIVIALLAISTPGVLPRPLAAPAFDAASAASLAAELSSAYPLRVPGTPEAALAAAWYRQTMAALGLPTEERVWRERLPGLGTIELRNVITVVRGRSPQAIVVVAHRDNGLQGEGDNASGTATLLELARAYGGLGQARPTVPQRTLILVSTDGGAWGGVGAARYAEEAVREHEVVAAV